MISLLALLVASEGLAATPRIAEIQTAQIDSVCARVSALARSTEPQRVFADFSDPSDRNAPADWRNVPDTAKLKQMAEDTYPYTQAFVWNDQGATFVQMFVTSPSGDWALYEDHCFDRDGALIRNEGTLSTFNAIGPNSDVSVGVSRVKTTYFDAHGQIITSETRLIDLRTKEPTPRRQVMNREDQVYKSIAELPFVELMTR